MTHIKDSSLWPIASLFVFGFLLYAGTVSHPFIHDDYAFLANQSGKGIVSFFLNPSSTSGMNPYYRPVLDAFYALQYKVFHFHAQGYHIINILLHVGNSTLIFLLLQRFTKRKGLSWCIALFFLIHPVQTEAVSCISGSSNLFTALLMLLSLWLLVLSSRFSDRKMICYAGSLLLYILALLSKEQAIVLPALIFLYGFIYFEKNGHIFKKNLILFSGFICTTLLYLMWRKILFGNAIAPLLLYKEELFLRLKAIPYTLLMHSKAILFPADLHYYRSVDVLQPLGAYGVYLLIIILGICIFVRYLPKQKSQWFILGTGWFIITLLPTLNIIPLVNEYSFIAAFEHFLYLPLAGFLLIVMIPVDHFLEAKVRSQKRTAVIMSLFVIILGAATVRQTAYWRGEIPLLERSLRLGKPLGRVHLLLGRAYYFDRQYDKAIEHLTRTINIMQGYLKKVDSPVAQKFYNGFTKEAYFVMADSYVNKGQYKKAIEKYDHVLKIDPRDAGIHNNIGTVYLYLDDLTGAIRHFQESLRLDPQDLMAMSNLAVCYIRNNNKAEAEKLLRAALMINPEFPQAKQNLNSLLKEKNQ